MSMTIDLHLILVLIFDIHVHSATSTSALDHRTMTMNIRQTLSLCLHNRLRVIWRCGRRRDLYGHRLRCGQIRLQTPARIRRHRLVANVEALPFLSLWLCLLLIVILCVRLLVLLISARAAACGRLQTTRARQVGVCGACRIAHSAQARSRLVRKQRRARHTGIHRLAVAALALARTA